MLKIMNWTKLLYVLIIVLLYVPMVFLGANVFFFRNIPELMLIIKVLSVIVTPNILILPIQKN